MGTLTYGSPETVYTIDDRALAHLQIVIFSKLRYGEHFVFSCQRADNGAPTMLWMAPGIPIRIDIDGTASISINRQWLRSLARSAYTAEGLRLVDEPGALRTQSSAGRQRQLTR